jgi:hypothetical protein
MTLGEYLKRRVRQGLRVIYKGQRKVRPNQLGPSKEKLKKELPSISVRFFEKYFRFSVGTHLALVCDAVGRNVTNVQRSLYSVVVVNQPKKHYNNNARWTRCWRSIPEENYANGRINDKAYAHCQASADHRLAALSLS